jgi:hypothetical protein
MAVPADIAIPAGITVSSAMPVTPFHFGIGLLGKGLAPRRVSLAAFVASQIVIDCETAYFLFVAQEWPVHRWAHTLVVGTLVGLAVGFAWGATRRLWPVDHGRSVELALPPSIAGGLLGGLTHPLLDAIMHVDVQPFRPFLDGNPLLRLISLTHLHLACVVAALVGAGLLLSANTFRKTKI